MKKYNIIYLTTYIDDKLESILELPYAPAGLKKKKQMLDVLSQHNLEIIFVSLFTRLSKIIIKPFSIKVYNNITLRVPFFIKLPFLNYIINPIFVFKELYKRNKKQKIDYIILYNCVYENTVPAYFMNKLYNTKIICQYEDGWVVSSKGIKKLIYKFSHNLAKSISNGVIINSLTFLDIFSTKHFYLFRGNIFSKKCLVKDKTIHTKLNILFASNIDNIRGAELLIELFNNEKSQEFISQFNFYITGRGDERIIKELESSIQKFNNNGGSAKFYGFVSLEKLKKIYQESDILLALQKPDGMFSKYCFPSKIFEYYEYNKPIITTKISDLESEEFFNLEFIEYSIESLKEKLNIVKKNYIFYKEKNSINNKILEKKFSIDVNKEKMNLFLELLDEN